MSSLAISQFGLAPALAATLFHALWQCGLLGVAAALSLRALAPASAALRHQVGMAFMIAMVCFPALQFVFFWSEPSGMIDDGPFAILSAPRLDEGAQLFVQQSSDLPMVVVTLWLCGIVVMALRHVVSLRIIAALESRPHQPLPSALRTSVERMRQAMGIARQVSVRLSQDVLSPWTARLVRPVIWLPLSMLTRTPEDQIKALLAHELAHIARRDWLWNGIQCAVETLLFFHPVVWWLGRRVRQEREHACDDLAVMAHGDAVALAEALTALECERRHRPQLALSANGGTLMRRISRLLSGPQSRGRWGALALGSAALLSGTVLVTQVGLAGGMLPDLQVRASTDGPLGPGDFREITASGIDGRRFYRQSVDAAGRVAQTYREDGVERPIDASVEAWIDEVGRIGIPSHAKIALQHPVIGTGSAQPVFALAAGHRVVTGRLGLGAEPTAKPVNGDLMIDDGVGSADLEVEMRGSKAVGIVHVIAVMKNDTWQLRSVTID